MVIVGTNLRAFRFAQEIKSKPALGYRLLGYVENDWQGNHYFNTSITGRCGWISKFWPKPFPPS